jgi:hypothetical protein
MPVEPVIPQKRSAIDKIIQGLEVVQTVGGLKSDYEKSKLMQLQQEQAKRDLEKQQEMDANIYDPKTASNFVQASADDKRAQQGFIKTKNDKGEVDLKSFWFISPDRLAQENRLADLTEQERKTRLESQYSEGRARPADYDHNIVVYGGKNPGGGFRKAWDIVDGKKVDIWLKPMRQKTLDEGKTPLIPAFDSGGKGFKFPLITEKDLKTPEEKAGYRNAAQKLFEKGIPQEEIPYRISISDVYAYSPKKLETDRKDISVKMKDYVELMPTVRNVDRIIEGIDSDKPIKGAQELRNAQKIGTFSQVLGRIGIQDPEKIKQAAISRTSPESQRLFTALSALKSEFNKLKSGLSLTKDELAAAENALGISEFATDAQLRQGIRQFVAAIRSGMQRVESGYHDASIENYKQGRNTVTSEDPIFQRLDGNGAIVTTPVNKKDEQRNSAINFIGG